MRFLVILLALLALPQCASDRREEAQPPATRVIIGVAKSSDNRGPVYEMLWRRLDARSAFADYDDARAFEARTNAGRTIRVTGLPGEFAVLSVEPGVYALDGVFAHLREGGLSYIAQGVIEGPERPAFEIREGETIYLGIWEMDIDGVHAVTRLWRLEESDARAVAHAARRDLGPVRLRATHTLAVPCRPRPMSNLSQREIC